MGGPSGRVDGRCDASPSCSVATADAVARVRKNASGFVSCAQVSLVALVCPERCCASKSLAGSLPVHRVGKGSAATCAQLPAFNE